MLKALGLDDKLVLKGSRSGPALDAVPGPEVSTGTEMRLGFTSCSVMVGLMRNLNNGEQGKRIGAVWPGNLCQGTVPLEVYTQMRPKSDTLKSAVGNVRGLSGRHLSPTYLR